MFTDDENAVGYSVYSSSLSRVRNNVVYFAESLTFDQIAEGEGDIERIAENSADSEGAFQTTKKYCSPEEIIHT